MMLGKNDNNNHGNNNNKMSSCSAVVCTLRQSDLEGGTKDANQMEEPTDVQHGSWLQRKQKEGESDREREREKCALRSSIYVCRKAKVHRIVSCATSRTFIAANCSNETPNALRTLVYAE